MSNEHECARCGGEGTPYPSDPINCTIHCGRCKGEGRCSGYIDPGTGECVHCGWSYDGPNEVDYHADGPAERQHRAEQARRLK